MQEIETHDGQHVDHSRHFLVAYIDGDQSQSIQYCTCSACNTARQRLIRYYKAALVFSEYCTTLSHEIIAVLLLLILLALSWIYESNNIPAQQVHCNLSIDVFNIIISDVLIEVLLV